MPPPTAAIVLGLTLLACRAAPRPADKPEPARPKYTYLDSLGLAGLDSFFLAKRSRPHCPMPVVRGDSSNDSGMVLKIGPRGLPPTVRAPCYNPLFDASKGTRMD